MHKWKWSTHLGRCAEIRDIGKEVESSTDSQSKRSRNLERPYWISDIIEHVIHV